MRVCLILTLLIVSSGCTNLALKRATISQAESTANLRYQEVIENLAMIASNPELLPAYSSMYSTTSDINDIGKASSTSVWTRNAMKAARFATFFSQQTADFSGSRAVKNNWSLDPTIVPEKLRAMRAACRWVTDGPQSVGPDMRYLMKFKPHDDAFPPGFYFDVIKRLEGVPNDWLHFADHRVDVPHNACYWAGCGGKFVWVGPEDMGHFSNFVLVFQQIARADLAAAHSPTQTTKIEKTFDFPNEGDPVSGRVTFFVDEKACLTSGEDAPAIPKRIRFDNVGQDSDVKSVINASAKSP